MTSKFYQPTLSKDGWVNSTIKVFDSMISHFFLSDYSQSTEASGDVVSFAWLVQHHLEDMPGLLDALQNALMRYFSDQFNHVEVSVEEVPNPMNENKQKISVFITFTDQEGIQHNLARLIQHDNLRVNEILTVINTGKD